MGQFQRWILIKVRQIKSQYNNDFLSETLYETLIIISSLCRFFQCPAAKVIVPDWGNIVDSDIGLSYRPASLYAAWRAGTAPQSRSQLYPPNQGLWIWILFQLDAELDFLKSLWGLGTEEE